MSAPCQHPEEERDEIKDTGFGVDHEWCGECGAMRYQYSKKHGDGSYTMEWHEWTLPRREAARTGQ
jgi:hypothetical protein